MNFDRSNLRSAMRTGVLVALLACSSLLQGCLAVAWVAVVGVDSLRSSDITFWPFEQSWVSQTKTAVDDPDTLLLTSVALLPVEGDDEMRTRLAQIFQQQTTLRVESMSEPEGGIADSLTDDDRSAIAKDLTRELVVDAVLFGRVSEISAHPHPSDWGWKQEESRRLYLHLVDYEGRLLWKDELPYTVVIGAKPPIEHAVQTSLTHHLMDHVRDLRLDDLGYFPRKSS